MRDDSSMSSTIAVDQSNQFLYNKSAPAHAALFEPTAVQHPAEQHEEESTTPNKDMATRNNETYHRTSKRVRFNLDQGMERHAAPPRIISTTDDCDIAQGNIAALTGEVPGDDNVIQPDLRLDSSWYTRSDLARFQWSTFQRAHSLRQKDHHNRHLCGISYTRVMENTYLECCMMNSNHQESLPKQTSSTATTRPCQDESQLASLQCQENADGNKNNDGGSNYDFEWNPSLRNELILWFQMEPMRLGLELLTVPSIANDKCQRRKHMLWQIQQLQQQSRRVIAQDNLALSTDPFMMEQHALMVAECIRTCSEQWSQSSRRFANCLALAHHEAIGIGLM